MLSEDVQVRPGIQVLPKRMTIATNLPSTVNIFLASDLFSCISIKVTCDLNDHSKQQHLQGMKLLSIQKRKIAMREIKNNKAFGTRSTQYSSATITSPARLPALPE